MMESWRFRKLLFGVYFLVLVPVSLLLHYPPLDGGLARPLHFFGLFLLVASGAFAFYTHSLFPKRHDRPGDFENLLKDGPYRFVRHPFYSAFIFLGLGIALLFLSVPGLVAWALTLPLWERLAELEERELLEHWGEDYRRFMETRGRFLPRLRGCAGRLLAVLLLFLIGYLTLYGLRFLFVGSLTLDFLLRISLLLPPTFGFAFLLAETIGTDFSPGIKRAGFLRSFLLASAVSLPSPLLQLRNPSAHFNPQAPLPVIFLSYFLFALYAFSIFMAFPLDALRPCKRLWIVVPLLFLPIYDSYFFNAHRLPPAGDVVLFVLLYPIVYRKTGNVLGIVLAYLIVAEWDPWWAFGAVFGLEALKIVSLLRVGVSISATVMLLIQGLKPLSR